MPLSSRISFLTGPNYRIYSLDPVTGKLVPYSQKALKEISDAINLWDQFQMSVPDMMPVEITELRTGRSRFIVELMLSGDQEGMHNQFTYTCSSTRCTQTHVNTCLRCTECKRTGMRSVIFIGDKNHINLYMNNHRWRISTRKSRFTISVPLNPDSPIMRRLRIYLCTVHILMSLYMRARSRIIIQRCIKDYLWRPGGRKSFLTQQHFEICQSIN